MAGKLADGAYDLALPAAALADLPRVAAE